MGVIVDTIDKNLKYITKYNEQHHYGDWEKRSIMELNKFYNDVDGIDVSKLEMFKGGNVFVADEPNYYLKGFYSKSYIYKIFIKLLHKIHPKKIAAVKIALNNFNILSSLGVLPLLKKYPATKTGAPFNLKFKGYIFTNRYLRHIYLLSGFNRYLKPVLRDAPVFLDIGCSYGGFEYLLKKELPSSKHILVDMPGQLVLAFFYLKKEFPDSKIAFFEEVGNSKIINEDFIDSYDFVLIPTIFYDKLETKSIDVVFNFLSLSEMTEEWFNIYTQSLPYVSSKYIYLVNRYDSNPTYSNDITVYDYKLSDYEKMFMRTLPIIKHMYVVKYFFFVVKKRYPSEFFQFIGKNRRKDDPKKINTV